MTRLATLVAAATIAAAALVATAPAASAAPGDVRASSTDLRVPDGFTFRPRGNSAPEILRKR